jgi:hypothetical protein
MGSTKAGSNNKTFYGCNWSHTVVFVTVLQFHPSLIFGGKDISRFEYYKGLHAGRLRDIHAYSVIEIDKCWDKSAIKYNI